MANSSNLKICKNYRREPTVEDTALRAKGRRIRRPFAFQVNVYYSSLKTNYYILGVQNL